MNAIEKYRYQGTVRTNERKCDTEKRCIGKGNDDLQNINKVFRKKKITLEIKERVLNS